MVAPSAYANELTFDAARHDECLIPALKAAANLYVAAKSIFRREIDV